MMRVNVALDEDSIQRLARLADWQIRFDTFIEDALGRSVEVVQKEAEDVMWSSFMNPTGQIEDSLKTAVLSPTTAALWTEEPYGQRLEFGFSGKTDSLGRFYPYWPAYMWAHITAENAKEEVEQIFLEELDAATNL